MQPRIRSDREDRVEGIVADRSATCILPERSATAQGIATRPNNGFMHEREDVTAMLTGATSAIETVKIAQLTARYLHGPEPDAKHCGAMETIRTTYWPYARCTAIVYAMINNAALRFGHLR